MKTFNSFINLMSQVLDLLPRYLDLTEKEFRSNEEEVEFDDISVKMDNIKMEINKILPDLNQFIYKDMIEHYYRLRKETDNGEPIGDNNYNDLKRLFQAPLNDMLKNSLN